MKRVPAYSLGFELTKEVASSAEEFNQLAKKEDAVLDTANDNVLYRSVFPQFREAICEHIESVTGIQRQRTGEGEEAVVTEKDASYIKRVQATIAKEENVSPESVLSRFSAKAQELMDKSEYNPAERERKGGGNLIPKNITKIINEVYQKGIQEEVAQKLSAKGFLVTLTGNADEDKKALGRAVHEQQTAKRKEQETLLKSELGMG